MIRPRASEFAGSHGNGVDASSPLETYIQCSFPEPDTAYTRTGSLGAGVRRGAAGSAGASTFTGIVTAPRPGSPTVLRAGPSRPLPRGRTPATATGNRVEVGRATCTVLAQPGDDTRKRVCHSRRARSVSIASTL